MNTLSPSQVIKHLATAAQSQIAPAAPHESTYLQASKGGKIYALILVLVGKQGTRKTTWLRKLVPNALTACTHEGALRESKDTIHVLRGTWLAIDDVMVGLSRKETECTKQLTSHANFQYRPPCGHLDDSVERRVSLAGSTNEETFLVNRTGTPRFLPVGVISKGDIPAMLDFKADRLWRQAKNLAETGNVKPLPLHEQQTILESSRSSYEDLPTVVEIVTQDFEIAKTERDGTWMTCRELRISCPIQGYNAMHQYYYYAELSPYKLVHVLADRKAGA
jgi:predicted P-loop ATPase